MDELVSLLDYVLWLNDTAAFKTFRMAGYVAFATTLWYLTLAGFHFRDSYYYVITFRWCLLAGAVHHTIVAIWAALIEIHIPVPNAEFTFLLTFSTGFLAYGTMHGFWRIYKDT